MKSFKRKTKAKKLNYKAVKVRLIIFSALVAALIVISLIAPLIEPNDPYATSSANMRQGPGGQFPFGTDSLGRCGFSRVLAGAFTSIFSSIFLVAVSFGAGTIIGMFCGYFGGIVDTIIMRITDALLAFPQMVLAIAVAGVLGGNLTNALIAIGITSWTLYARLARGQTYSIKNETFIAALKLSGVSNMRIMFRHILPNIFRPLIATACTQIGTTMIYISGLSFLGLGVIPPAAEWGSMINEARGYFQLTPWAVIGPSIAMLITILIFNFFGDAVRDMTEVRGNGR